MKAERLILCEVQKSLLTVESQSGIILDVSLSVPVFRFLTQLTACSPSVVPVESIMQKYLKLGTIRVTVAVRLKYLESRTF